MPRSPEIGLTPLRFGLMHARAHAGGGVWSFNEWLGGWVKSRCNAVLAALGMRALRLRVREGIYSSVKNYSPFEDDLIKC